MTLEQFYEAVASLGEPYYDDGGGRIVFCGDCRELLPSLPDGVVDLVLTDPPYGIPVGSAFVRGGGRVIEDGSGGYNESVSWDWLNNLHWLIDGGNIAVFHRRGDFLPSHIEQWHRFYLIKDTPPPTPRPVFVSAVEECTIGRKPGPSRWFGNGYKLNYWRGMTPNQRGCAHGHPVEKPLEAIVHLAICLSDVGEVIFDPFLGSGTTLVAAKQIDRHGIGIEIEEKYCEIAKQRLVTEGQIQNRSFGFKPKSKSTTFGFKKKRKSKR